MSTPSARQRLRSAVPFGLRVGLRRAPHVVRWLVSPPAVTRGDPEAFPHLAASRSSPLRRQSTLYAEALQRAKEHNVRRAASLVDGVVLPPGGRLSWHDTVGPPVRLRGFVPGPELHGDALAAGGGGGLCQVSNLVLWLGVHAGLEVEERHRHGLDLFPDGDRDVPFGLGATVFYPRLDLVLRNPHDQPVLVRLWVEGLCLHGEVRLCRDPGRRWAVEQVAHRFVELDGEVWRENRLIRRVLGPGEQERVQPLMDNRARVLYPVEDPVEPGGEE